MGKMFGAIPNPSKTATMVATIRIQPTGETRTYRIPPRGNPLPVVGPVHWHLWTLSWEEPKRRVT